MRKTLMIAGALAIAFSSCQKQKKESEVVSQRFIHKYGYAVSKDEWNAHSYPGQVVSHLRDGVTLTQTFEAGILHGPTIKTFPDSEIVAHYYLYDKGSVVKEIHYDTTGMPKNEKVTLSPSRYQYTTWYADGTPKSIEEYAQNELLEGQYFTKTNDVESKIEKGNGLKIARSAEGLLLAKEEFAAGYPTKKETFFANGALETLANFEMGKLHGEKKVFAMTGEPLSVEEYVNDQLHGKATYFRNGNKHKEISYLYGQKNGLETHFVDGDKVSYQVAWENDKKHGVEQYFTGESPTLAYFYEGQSISKNRYDELTRLDAMIADISSDVKSSD